MNLNKRISILIFFSLVLSTSSKAQVGRLEDVIEAAIKGQEPGYIKELMESLGQRLQLWAHAKGNTARERAALMSTFRSFERFNQLMEKATRRTVFLKMNAWYDNDDFRNSFPVTSRGSWHAAPNHDFCSRIAEEVQRKSSLYNDLNAFPNDALYIGVHLFQSDAFPCPKEIASLAARALVHPTTGADLCKIAYRTVEWIVLNHFLENAEKYFDVVYRLAVEKLRNSDCDFFSHLQGWRKFRRNPTPGIEYPMERFERIQSDSVFFVPWMNLLDTYFMPWKPRVHRYYSIECRDAVRALLFAHRRGNLLKAVPRDVLFGYLIPYVIGGMLSPLPSQTLEQDG